MHACLRHGLIAFALISAPVLAQAELTVVADHGGQPARPYYEPIKPAGVPERQGYSAKAEARARAAINEAVFPVQSKQLTPGSVATRPIQLPQAMTPVFLVGAGQLSQRWLKQRGPRLRELGATGLVVDVTSAAQLRRLRRIGNGLVLRPVSGDDIARRLDIAHYPVLITPEAIQQ